MIQAVLFDLDDTLLGNNADLFVPAYFKLVSEFSAELISPDDFLAALLSSTKATIDNVDLAVTNYEAFWNAFTAKTGLQGADVARFFERFYAEKFADLRPYTQTRPSARPLVQNCFDRGLQVVVATNPLFPQVAIEQRLAWAGVPVTDFDYAFVTTMENSHATKPHLGYYQEILDTIGCAPRNAIMVGDDWVNDIEPAANLGLATFWVADETAEAPDLTLINGRGSLDNFYQELQAGWLGTL